MLKVCWISTSNRKITFVEKLNKLKSARINFPFADRVSTAPDFALPHWRQHHSQRKNSLKLFVYFSLVVNREHSTLVGAEGKWFESMLVDASILPILISISYELPNSNRFQSLIFNELMCCWFESNKETLLKQYTESNQLWQLFASMQIQVSLAKCYSIS